MSETRGSTGSTARATATHPAWLPSIGIFSSSVAFFVSTPLVPIYFLDLAGERSGTALVNAGVAVAVSFWVGALVAPLWGRLSDRFGTLSMALRASICIVAVYCLMTVCRSPEQLIAVRFLTGLASGYVPAMQSFVIRVTPQASQGTALARVSAARTAGGIAGPAIGGLTAALAGIRYAFLAAAVLGALAGVCALTLRMRYPDPGSGRKSSQKWRMGGKQVHIFLLMAILAIGGGALQLGIPVILMDRTGGNLHSSSALAGTLFTCSALAAFVGAPLWGKAIDRFGAKPTGVACAACGSAALLVGVFTNGLVQDFTLLILISFITGELTTVSFILLSKTVESSAMGYFAGIAQTMNQIGAGVGIYVVGSFGSMTPATFYLLLAALTALALVLIAAHNSPVQSQEQKEQ